MEDRLLEILDKLSEARVLVFGDIMLDSYIFGDASRLSPEAPVPIVRVDSEISRPGGAANTAANVLALGADVKLVSLIGEDTRGNDLANLIEEEGMPIGGLVVDRERQTTFKERVLARNQQIARVDRESPGPISSATANLLIDNYVTALNGVDAVILSDYGKGVVTPRTSAAVIESARENGTVVTVDPKVEHFHIYRHVTSATPNHFEAERAAGIPASDETSFDRIGRKLLEMLESSAVLITRGKDGMVLYKTDGETERIPTRAREVYDVAGAGDTVIATYTTALAVGASHLEAAQLANFAASVVIGKVGTATADREEIGRAVNDYKKRNSE
ncbi:MAG: D-glycero-beta-D-manno-heptose-7-phosphate kinase [bacterium]|nr:D-glycero-beta-D-manno-heptose-7-phosphate kinase [bacterium]